MTWKAFYELERGPGCQAAVYLKEWEPVSKPAVIKSGLETPYVQNGCSCFWLAVNEKKISTAEESQEMEIRMLVTQRMIPGLQNWLGSKALTKHARGPEFILKTTENEMCNLVSFNYVN